MKPMNSSFAAASDDRKKRTPFAYAYDTLLKDIGRLTAHLDDSEDITALNEVEPQLRGLFRQFLLDLDMPLAVLNFDALLEEKSGSKFLRNDGSVNWYHEFIPLMTVMYYARIGYKKGGFDLEDLEQYGGLETLIVSHVRHDSVEDFMKGENFAERMEEMREQQRSFLDSICRTNPDYDCEKGGMIIENSLNNIDLMTQKWVVDEKGQKVKEDVFKYTSRLVKAMTANPIVFMLKQADIIHNFATLFGANKFSPERRSKRCNEREDMYGPRYDYLDTAYRKWPKFHLAIEKLDCLMGGTLYPHFRYLQDVDLYEKTPQSDGVGIYRYMRGILSLKTPDIINPMHISIKRMTRSVDPDEDPLKYGRLKSFLRDTLAPNLEPFADRFSYFFKREKINPSRPSLDL